MKNKRNVLIAFILICCLCLSIGYAALTDTLYVTGKADVTVLGNEDDPNTHNTPFEQKFADEIYWSAAVPEESGEGKVTATIGPDEQDEEKDKVTITVPAGILTHEGDSTVVYATIKNDSDYNAEITWTNPTGNITGTAADGKAGTYSVSYEWNVSGFNGVIAEDGGTSVVKITIKLVNAPLADDTCSFSLTFTANATTTTAGASNTYPAA